MPVRLITADATTLSRLGYRTAVGDCADLELVAQATEVTQTLALMAEHQPQVVVIDFALPNGSLAREHGLDLARTLRAEHPRLGLLLVGPDNHDLVLRSLEAGLSGYLSRSVPVEVLLSAIRHAAVAPTSFTSPDLANAMLRRRHSNVLSPREQEVLQHLHNGQSLASIAKQLRVTESTVRTYATRIHSKLQVHDRADMIRPWSAGAANG